MAPAPAPTEADVLALWERGTAAPPGWRADALLNLAETKTPVSLGARNAALLALRSRLFGDHQELIGSCPECGTAAEFAIHCSALAASLQPDPDAGNTQRLTVHGHAVEFRLPNADDLRAAAADIGFARRLLHRCLLRCTREDGTACAPEELPADVALALSARMEALDPGASIGYDLTCPECGTLWPAILDVGAVLWAEIQAAAERVLVDVAALAGAYGWSEAQVLALSPTRRAAYLQLAEAR